MENLKQKMEDSKPTMNSFENRLKNRYNLEGSSLLGSESDHSVLFEKDNSISQDFSVLQLKFERATLREASSFKKFMENSISEDGRNILVDLSNCEFVDSSFFGVLVGGVKRLKAMKMKFYIAYNSQNRLPIFSATGLDKVFTVFDSVEEAIEH